MFYFQQAQNDIVLYINKLALTQNIYRVKRDSILIFKRIKDMNNKKNVAKNQ